MEIFDAVKEHEKMLKNIKATPGQYYERILKENGRNAAKLFFNEVRKHANNSPRRF